MVNILSDNSQFSKLFIFMESSHNKASCVEPLNKVERA